MPNLNQKILSPTTTLALNVHCTDDTLTVNLSDGRQVSVPLEWFPRLRDATPKQRKNWRLIAKGIGIHWENVDEDIAVSTLLRAW
ncbi:MAG: DUF2442 domain-containing protein [Chloroflexi bacterium]|nr:DUF2442 domain-containing protein [Chloroflexota bacterium]